MSATSFRYIRWTIAVFYTYGALVHVMNISGFGGFDWPSAPLKWHILDIVYLVLDIVVVAGFPAGRRAGYIAFFTAACSQIVLYTVLRSWVVDVPQAFQPSPDQIAYLDLLAGFHAVTVLIILAALRLRRSV